MKQTDKTFNGLPVSYDVQETEYTIYLDNKVWIMQYGEYAKPIDKTKTLEENCLLQIKEIVNSEKQELDNPLTYEDGYDQAILDLIESGVL